MHANGCVYMYVLDVNKEQCKFTTMKQLSVLLCYRYRLHRSQRDR